MTSNLELLRKNAELNNLNWLFGVYAAVGQQSGTLELLTSEIDTMWATTRGSWAEILHGGTASSHVKAERVPTVTVDDFMQRENIQKVSLMKIDVEAAEMDVLAGASRALSEGRVEQALVEVQADPQSEWDDVADLFRSYGYQITDLKGAEMHAWLP